MERMKWVLVGVLLTSMGLNAYWIWSNKSQTAGGSRLTRTGGHAYSWRLVGGQHHHRRGEI